MTRPFSPPDSGPRSPPVPEPSAPPVSAPPAPARARSAAAHLLYDFGLLALLVVGSPYFLYRIATARRFRAGLAQRLGFVPLRPGGRPCLWIHGVSVGEVKAARPLVESLGRRHPQVEVALSSTTETGNALAARLYPERFRFYYPLDLPLVPSRVLSRVRPRWIVLMELEIWPNFLRASSRLGVPVALVNGRISEKSWRGYRRAGRLLPQLDRIALYCVQNRRYAERFLDLGVPPSRVFVTGNMKFDNVIPSLGSSPDPGLVALLGLRPGETVLVGGSTHETEEVALWRASRVASLGGPPPRLLLAPRHPERAPAVIAAIEAEGGRAVRWTALRAGGGAPPSDAAVVVDTIGELERVYALADVVFVGGSLVPHGGQNVLEPASLARPILFGPHTFNFEDEVALLLEGDGARRVEDAQALERALRELLADRAKAREMGERAAARIEAQRGATARTLEVLERAFLVPGRAPVDAACSPG